MEYIEKLFYLAHDYWLLTLLIGTLSCFIESFLPMLPLIALVGANAFFFGLLGGLVISWISSGLGTTCLFLLISRFNNHKLINKFKNEKIEKGIGWIHKQGFKILFIAYSCPFIPGFLVTIACALCDRKLKDFAPAMLSGKFVMFLFVSYPSSNIQGFITNPFKVIIFIGLVFASWKIGNRVNTRLSEENNLEVNTEIANTKE